MNMILAISAKSVITMIFAEEALQFSTSEHSNFERLGVHLPYSNMDVFSGCRNFLLGRPGKTVE